MPRTNRKISSLRRLVASAALAVAVAIPVAMPVAAFAQVVVVANGSPITAYDIEQRSKLMAKSAHKAPTRQQVIQDLIDDRLKLAKAKTYGFEVGKAEVDQAYANMAKAQHISTQQFDQLVERSGISPNTIKARLRAQLTWNQLVRGKFSASLEVGETDVSSALRARNASDSDVVGYIYTLYPIMIIVPQGSSAAIIGAKHREAENLRSRFTSCKAGLALSRALRDVAVRESTTRSSADLAPQLRDMLGKIQIGRLTPPEVTAQGLQMFALCDKKESKNDSPLKTEVRKELLAKRYDSESARFLEEIRKQAMIEYK